ncbi:hypothetical protein CSW53_26085 (plasmid) [Rhodococcus ruber]|nr:hypothetical protein CSW53_26085 [Rhodococcus ruber]
MPRRTNSPRSTAASTTRPRPTSAFPCHRNPSRGRRADITSRRSGQFREFLNGPIYWHPNAGAHPVVNHFFAAWQRNGWEAGPLGYPTTDEIVNPDGLGRRQEFQNTAAIYWRLNEAYAIRGAIRDKWNTVNAEQPGSLLGYPTSDEIVLPDGQGRMNRFERGVLYWHPTHQAHPVSGAILDQWSLAGYERSRFGYPTGDPANQGTVAAEQQFQNDKIYAPNMSVPLGASGVNLTLGVPTAAALSAGPVPDGVILSGQDFSLTFQRNSLGNINVDYFRTTAQAPAQFKMIAGLPAGYSINIANNSAEVRSSNGTVIGRVTFPLTFGGNGLEVSTNTNVSGNELTVDLGTSSSYPHRSFLRATNVPYPAPEAYENLSDEERQVCRDDLPECYNTRNSGDDAKSVSYREYPNYKTIGEQDNRVDAVRHCAWLAYMTQRADADFASRMGNAHERAYYNEPLASAMDEYNNQTGIAVGLREEGSDTGIEITCRQYGRNARQVNTVPEVGENVNKNDLVFIHE